jgi:Uma2 family endonuclease
MGLPHVRSRRWTRAEYDRLIDLGVLHEDEPVELVGGDLVCKEPQAARHASAVLLVVEALRRSFGPGWQVRVQMPIAFGDDSEPEPDVAVVPGGPGDFFDDHPSEAVLVVEVALSSLDFDRGPKASLYARGRVPDYWIVDVDGRRLEVHRDPRRDDAAPLGWRYGATRAVGPDDVISPLVVPEAHIRVAELLPGPR